ncbi:MAG: AmmeMemoRadiSam system protein A [Armatimonadota bacterium]
MLNETQRETLLEVARKSLEAAVAGGETPRPEIDDPDLQRVQGAFVTLKKNGDLRGCIGNIVGRHPLVETVANMAKAAALEDPRFPPVTESELPQLHIEISVMSPLREIDDTDEIEVGRHGLVISRGRNRGLLLPQVPGEWGWDREEFLQHTCMKANLPPDAWRDDETTIEVFEAEVFGEET